MVEGSSEASCAGLYMLTSARSTFTDSTTGALHVKSFVLFVCLANAVLQIAVPAFADEPDRIRITDRLPFGQQPIDYHGAAANDAIAKLSRAIEAGDAKLKHDGTARGYLESVLRTLDVPVSSQVLVFSKTALNQHLVTPKNPRAVYFNDHISVGWVPGAHALELTAVDPVKGPMFYTLSQDSDRPVRIDRNARCLACHSGNTTNHVPGWMLRGFVTTRTGKPVSGYSRITHATEISKRWGGWYVTGQHGDQTHRGNVYGDSRIEQLKADPTIGGNLDRLDEHLEIARYPTETSDIVSHLVLDHQSHGLNLIVRANYEHLLGRRSDVEDQLVRYLVFADEAGLDDAVSAESKFAKEFASRGPKTMARLSLRDLDLKTRLFKWRLSYLVYSPVFARLAEPVRTRVLRRIWDGLRDANAKGFQHLPLEECQTIKAIVAETLRPLPEFWQQ